MNRIIILFFLCVIHLNGMSQTKIKDSIEVLIPRITEYISLGGQQDECTTPYSSTSKRFFFGTQVVLSIERLLNPHFTYNLILSSKNGSNLTLYDYYQIQSLYVEWWTNVNRYSIHKIRRLRDKKNPLDGSNYSFGHK